MTVDLKSISRSTFRRICEAAIRLELDDPVVEVLTTGSQGSFRVRVGGDEMRGPRYFRITVVEET